MLNISSVVKLLKSNIFLFSSSRIITYLIQFVNTLYIAIVLGPFYLGIWGFINLMIIYSGFLNLGIPLALGVNLARNYANRDLLSKMLSQSVILTFACSVIIGLAIIIISWFNISYFNKYNADSYFIILYFIIVLIQFNNLYTNVYRVSGKLFKVAFFQTSVQFSFLIVLIFSFYFNIKNSNVIFLLLIAYLVSGFASLLLFLIKSPIKLKFNMEILHFHEIKKTINQGLNLLLFNVSFNLMIIGSKTIISYFYSIEEFGFFSFSWNLAQATIMILQIVSFILSPKMLNRFYIMNNDQVYDLIAKVNKIYVTISFLLVYIAFASICILVKIFPQYQSAFPLFVILSLSVALYNFSFGTSTYLIAKKKEKILSFYSIISCMICMVIVLLMSLFKLPYIYTGASIFISYIVMILMTNSKVYSLLSIKQNILFALKEFFSYYIWIPMAFSFLLIISEFYLLYFIPLVLFIAFNFYSLKDSLKAIKNTINNPNFINI